MPKTLTYAGIGSRETVEPILNLMTQIGHDLAKSGWLLRSGFADGADNAFAYGAEQAQGKMELFVPWKGFNNAPNMDDRIIIPDFSDLQMNIAAKCHPAWNMCSPGAKKLHARNVNQVLGKNLDDPSDLIICWTPNGSGSGGTGQAIRVAKIAEVPVFDLAIHGKFNELVAYVDKLETANNPPTEYTWSRYGGYECSSKGDQRFSAMFALMPDGRTIEQHYQCDVKGYQPGGTNWRLGKGKPPLDKSKDMWTEYLKLWQVWAQDHTVLLAHLKEQAKSKNNVLSDMFATSPINQARALADILNQLGKNNVLPR